MAAQPNPDWGMTGKVAIVTGGGAAGDGIGNGRAAAILLAGAGARVLVVDREVALAERTMGSSRSMVSTSMSAQACSSPFSAPTAPGRPRR